MHGAMLMLTVMVSLCCRQAAAAAPAHCTRQEATDFQAPGSKCPGKPCADLGGDGSGGHGFGAADAQACCQLCADYQGAEECRYAVFQQAADKARNCFLKGAPADAIVGGVGNLGMELLPPSSGWGSTLLVLLLLFGAGYVGGGVVLGMRTAGKKGLAAHPHYHRWIELHGLVIDGGSAVRRPASARSGTAKRGSARDPERGYHSTAETEPLRPAHRDRKGGSAACKGAKQKGGATSGAGKRDKEKQEHHGSGASGTAPRQTQTPAAAPSGGNSRGSAAGDGGRWVHVPN